MVHSTFDVTQSVRKKTVYISKVMWKHTVYGMVVSKLVWRLRD